MENETYDLLIAGGGIAGTSAARDASGRGFSVLLCEARDIGWATSSSSTKLLHGGLRYLEHYEFRLVREALAEREVLLATAPHIAWRMRFILPHAPWLRPQWMIRAGLFLYDHLSRLRQIPGSEGVDLRKHLAGRDLLPVYSRGFEYSDLGVLDTRFCLYNALDARQRGASLLTRTQVVNARRENEVWLAQLRNTRNGAERTVRARCLVNTTGPWSNEFLRQRAESQDPGHIHLVKGSHIVVPKLFEHPYCYIMQNNDRRIVFAIPYEYDFTMIGTTDVDYNGDPGQVACTAQEREYLCAAANAYFRVKIKPEDVVWDFAGVRPLYSDGKDATSATRDYVFKIETDPAGKAPLLNVFGGKLTAAREIGEKIMERLLPHLGRPAPAWTATSPLPGGDLPAGDFEGFVCELRRAYPWLPWRMAHRYSRQYGTLAPLVLGQAKRLDDLGRCFGADLYEAEVQYMRDHELADDAAGVVWRRSRLGLHLRPEEIAALTDWMGA